MTKHQKREEDYYVFTNVFQDKIKFNADDIFTLSGEIFWEIFFKSSFYVLCLLQA